MGKGMYIPRQGEQIHVTNEDGDEFAVWNVDTVEDEGKWMQIHRRTSIGTEVHFIRRYARGQYVMAGENFTVAFPMEEIHADAAMLDSVRTYLRNEYAEPTSAVTEVAVEQQREAFALVLFFIVTGRNALNEPEAFNEFQSVLHAELVG